MNLLEIVASRVKELREERGWTQSKLSQEAKVAQSAISDIEQAKRAPQIDTLSQLAKALGTTTSYLLGEVQKSKAS